MFLSRRCRSRLSSKQTLLGILATVLLIGTFRTSLIGPYMETDYTVSEVSRDDPDMAKPQPQRGHISPPQNEQKVDPVTKRKDITSDNSTHYGCEKWYENTFNENLHVISQYPRGQADDYLWKIGGNLSEPKQMMTSFPVIVTAANSGFFGVTQGLLKTIHEKILPKYKEVKIIYYDLGLNADQLVKLKKHCRCEVRTFPFEEMPEHVRRLKTYTWKPLIIKSLLMEYGWIWWMDSSVRFKTDDLDTALTYSRDNSILFFTYGPVLSVAQHTDIQTMDYLHEDRCKFRPFGEIEATFVLFHFDHVTDVLVNAWAACALNSDCMCPPGTAGKLGCRITNKSDGRCHRFDQAVLSILLRRLYHAQNDYPLVKNPFHIHEIKRGNSVNYFPSD